MPKFVYKKKYCRSVFIARLWKSGAVLDFVCPYFRNFVILQDIFYHSFHLGIHMNNELYHGIKNWTWCSYSSLRLSIFLSFQGKFVSQFSQKLCKLCRIFKFGIHVYMQNEWLCCGIETQAHSYYSSNFYSFFYLSLCCMLTLKCM